MKIQSHQRAALPHVVVYTRRECHLCDEALQILTQHGLEPHCVDIDADPALRAQFDTCVPVVTIDERIHFRGAVHPVLLRRILQHWRDGR